MPPRFDYFHIADAAAIVNGTSYADTLLLPIRLLLRYAICYYTLLFTRSSRMPLRCCCRFDAAIDYFRHTLMPLRFMIAAD